VPILRISGGDLGFLDEPARSSCGLYSPSLRRTTGSGGSDYNSMLSESATIRVDAVAAPIDGVAREVLDALASLETAS